MAGLKLTRDACEARRELGRERPLSLIAQLYVSVVILGGCMALARLLPQADGAEPYRFLALLLLAIATASVKISLPLTTGGSTMTLSYAVILLALVTIGTPEAALIALASGWVQCTVRTATPNPPHRLLFNLASLVLSVSIAGWVLEVSRVEGNILSGFVGPLMFAAVAYFAANTLLVAGAVALASGQRFAKVWLDDFLWSAPGYFVGAAVAAIGAVATRQGVYWWTVVVAVPLYVTYRSYSTYLRRVEVGQEQAQQAVEVQFAIVKALALAIEAKDKTSQLQLTRLQIYAEGLGRRVGLSEPEIHALRTAALLHDVGNLAVPDHILAKPGPLTFEEFQKVKIHVRVGAQILESVPFPVPVAPLVLAHHEHWDGTGYPLGLKGEQIPLGARVLSVADAFTALMSERPHRPGMSTWEAIATLRRCAGGSLDPVLVDVFLELLPELEPQVEEALREADAPAPGDTEASQLPDQAFDDIAVARHEARALFEIAQALASTLGTVEAFDAIVAKLRELMPVSAAGLYLWREPAGRFSCRHAIGDQAETLRGLAPTSLETFPQAAPDAAGNPTAVASLLVSPLMVGDRLLGAFAVAAAQPGAFSRDHQRLLEQIARQAAPVIYNSLAFEQTRQDSLTDQLTNLPNRRYLLQHLEHEIARADRRKCSVALLMIDVNGFKQINDSHGHHVGDQALCEIGSLTRSLLRTYDICARYGGDEFVCVLWDCDAIQADRFRLDLMKAVAEARVTLDDEPALSLSVSVGCAVYPTDGWRGDQLLAMADGRMYGQKSVYRMTATQERPKEEDACPEP